MHSGYFIFFSFASCLPIELLHAIFETQINLLWLAQALVGQDQFQRREKAWGCPVSTPRQAPGDGGHWGILVASGGQRLGVGRGVGCYTPQCTRHAAGQRVIWPKREQRPGCGTLVEGPGEKRGFGPDSVFLSGAKTLAGMVEAADSHRHIKCSHYFSEGRDQITFRYH